jgi:hypothetical protein
VFPITYYDPKAGENWILASAGRAQKWKDKECYQGLVSAIPGGTSEGED